MGSQIIRVMNFVPADFQLALLFRSGLRVRHGTDGRTDKDRQRLMSSPMAAGHNQAINTAKATWVRSVCRWKFYLSQMQIFIKRIIVLFFLKMDQIDTHHKNISKFSGSFRIRELRPLLLPYVALPRSSSRFICTPICRSAKNGSKSWSKRPTYITN